MTIPPQALSDGANALPLDRLPPLLAKVAARWRRWFARWGRPMSLETARARAAHRSRSDRRIDCAAGRELRARRRDSAGLQGSRGGHRHGQVRSDRPENRRDVFHAPARPSLFLHPAEALHGDLGMLLAGDVVLAISYGGETEEIAGAAGTVKRLGVPLITLTGQSEVDAGRGERRRARRRA